MEPGGLLKCLPETDTAPSCFPSFLLEHQAAVRSHPQARGRKSRWERRKGPESTFPDPDLILLGSRGPGAESQTSQVLLHAAKSTRPKRRPRTLPGHRDYDQARYRPGPTAVTSGDRQPPVQGTGGPHARHQQAGPRHAVLKQRDVDKNSTGEGRGTAPPRTHPGSRRLDGSRAAV